MKCERNQRLIILVICITNDEKLEASVYEKHAENRKSSAGRETVNLYMSCIYHIMYIYYIYREYRP